MDTFDEDQVLACFRDYAFKANHQKLIVALVSNPLTPPLNDPLCRCEERIAFEKGFVRQGKVCSNSFITNSHKPNYLCMNAREEKKNNVVFTFRCWVFIFLANANKLIG
jgi:hypothetical protein